MSVPTIAAQHQAALTRHPEPCERISLVLQRVMVEGGLNIGETVDIAEAAIATFLQRPPYARDALGASIAVTVLLNGEVASDLFESLKGAT